MPESTSVASSPKAKKTPVEPAEVNTVFLVVARKMTGRRRRYWRGRRR